MTRREIRTRDYVTTADGAIYQIWDLRNEYDPEKGAYTGTVLANLHPLDGDSKGRITLPVGELRRVPDPAKKRPPIQGLPAERPTCEMCQQPLKPEVRDIWSGRPYASPIARREFVRWRVVADGFHSNGCAIRYARLCFKNGYRVQRNK
jgi:hypothetical protein